MADPITIPWHGVAASPYTLGAFDVSPDDRFALVTLHGGRPFLRVIDLANGEVVSELKDRGPAVRWIAPDLILCASAPPKRVDLSIVRVPNGEVVTQWSAPARNEHHAFVGLETSADGRCGLVHSVISNGPLHSLGGFWRVEMDADRSPLAVTPIAIEPRMSGYGRSAQRHTRIEVDRRTGMAIVAHQADVNAPHEGAVIDLRSGAVSPWIATRTDLGPHQPLPRWIAPRLVMFGDAPRDYDGTRIWLTTAPWKNALCEALLPRIGNRPESARALASLRLSTLHRDGRRAYGVHTSPIDGKWTTAAWITEVSDDLHAEPMAPWEREPEALTWVGEGVLAKMPEIATQQPLAFRPTPRDGRTIEVHRPSEGGLRGFVTSLSLSPAGKWVLLRIENRAAAWVPVDAIATAR